MGVRKKFMLFVAICVYVFHINAEQVNASAVSQKTRRNCKAYTTAGRVCSIPFVYKGVNYTKCTDVDSAPGKFWCSLTPDYDTDEKWAPCAGVNCDDCNVYTTEGQQCQFPFSYKGETYNYCTDIDSPNGLLWCSYNPVFDGQWGQCMDTLCGNCTVPTQWGKTCQFPFHYCGAERHHCIMGEDGRPWCSLNGYTTYQGVDWDYCMPNQCSGKAEIETSLLQIEVDERCKAFTISGRECSVPFAYKGTLYPNATDVDNQGVKWCSLTSDFDAVQQWQNYAGSICDGCTVLTTVGATCHFPFEYKGRTFDYCTTVDEERLWCSTDPVFNGTWGFCRTDQTVCGVSNQVCLQNLDEYQVVRHVHSTPHDGGMLANVSQCMQMCDLYPGCRAFAFRDTPIEVLVNRTGHEVNCHVVMNNEAKHSDEWNMYWKPKRFHFSDSDLRIVPTTKEVDYIEGRLEIFIDGRWSAICNHGWDAWAASNACIRMGYNYDESYLTDGLPNIDVVPGTGEIIVSDMKCGSGRIHRLFHHCEYSLYNNTCTHDEDVMISCLDEFQYSGQLPTGDEPESTTHQITAFPPSTMEEEEEALKTTTFSPRTSEPTALKPDDLIAAPPALDEMKQSTPMAAPKGNSREKTKMYKAPASLKANQMEEAPMQWGR